MKTLRKKTGKKKDQLTRPDEFLGFTQRAMNYAQEHTKQVYAALAVAGVVVALTVVVAVVMDTNQRKAQARLAEALQFYDINSPAPGKKPVPPAERIKKARDIFDELAKGGPLSDTALYYRANADMELGNMDAAIEGYRKLIDGSSGDNVMVSLARHRLAACYLAKGSLDEAEKAYMSIVEAKDGYMKDEAVFRLAGLYEAMGRKDEALIRYRALEKDYPKSPWLAEAKGKIAELGGTTQAAAAPPVAGTPATVAPAPGTETDGKQTAPR